VLLLKVSPDQFLYKAAELCVQFEEQQHLQATAHLSSTHFGSTCRHTSTAHLNTLTVSAGEGM
jgi:hypothetical protein